MANLPLLPLLGPLRLLGRVWVYSPHPCALQKLRLTKDKHLATICAVKSTSARGKFLAYRNNFETRPATTSEKWFPQCAQRLSRKHSACGCYIFCGRKTKSLSRKRRGNTLDENVRGRACESTPSENRPTVFAEDLPNVCGSSWRKLPYCVL